MNCLGVILARGGSKRVPRKNVRLLGDQPLIVWTIAAGKWSQLIDRLVVSSEDEEILQIAHNCRTENIRRPMKMASDEASSYPAMLHVLDQMDEPYDYLCLLQPTSPFRHPMDIDQCIALAMMKQFAAIASCTEGESVPNGAVYVGRTDWLRDGGNFDGPAVERYYMPKSRSLDIDTEEDFAKAEAMV